jgi:Tol biopolymer transport system component
MFSLDQASRVWSPDGLHLLGRRASQIVERSVSGEGETRVLADATMINFLEDITSDGKIALYSSDTNGDRSVFSIRLDGTRGSRANSVVQTGEQVLNPRFSPDGGWIVYEARMADNGRFGIFAQPFPGPGLRRQVSSNGIYPVWRKDGKEIVYIDTKSNQVSAISVSGSGDDLRFGSPTPLFAAPPRLNLLAPYNPLAVTRDGSRIILPVALPQPEDSNVIHIKSGWFETQH